MNILRLLSLLLLLTAADVLAQEPPEEPVLHLVPIVAEKVPGGFGSVWSTELLAFNATATLKVITSPCHNILCLSERIPPDSAVTVQMFRRDGGSYFIYSFPTSVTLQARVFDESRQNLNWGTHLPVIEWEAEKGKEFHFVRIPTAAPFRHTVRIYRHYAERGPLMSRVRYYDSATSELLAERIDDNYGFSVWHSTDIPEIAGREAVRIEVSSQSPVSIWAMVSVTNDETQFVTIIPGKALDPQP